MVQYGVEQYRQQYLARHWFPLIVQEIAELCKDKIVVDLGCGTGTYLLPAMTYTTQIIGVDSSKLMLNYTKKKYPEVPLILCDAQNIPIADGSVDTVLCIGLLEYVDRKIVMKEIWRILKSKGNALLVCPNKYSAARMPYKLYCKITGKPYFCDEPSYKELRCLIKLSKFSVVKVILNDGLIWLPVFIDRVIGNQVYRIIEWICRSVHLNSFSNVMLIVVEKNET